MVLLQAEDGKGNPVLYELMETAKDFITDQKLPTCGCAVCLCDFVERENGENESVWDWVDGQSTVDQQRSRSRIPFFFTEPDDFLRTDCFHFFHIECLTHYVEYSLAEIAASLEEKQKLNPHAEPDEVVSNHYFSSSFWKFMTR